MTNSPSDRRSVGTISRALRALASCVETLFEDARPELARKARQQLYEAKELIADLRVGAGLAPGEGGEIPPSPDAGPLSTRDLSEGSEPDR